MADIKISELSQAESLSLSDLMESAIPYNGGFQSRRMTIAQLSNYLENSVLHNALDTTTKNIIGAINEILHDLANYYTTSQTYSKTEVDTLIAGVSGLHFEVVKQLPTTNIDMNTIYLVPKQDVGTQDIYDEYICLDDTTTPATWEKIGTTEIDLSDYVTDTELTTILNDYVTSSGLSTILASYATTSAMTTALADKVDKVIGKGLSTEDYTTTEKAKLNGIESGAEVNVQSDWNQTDNTKDDFIKNKPTIPTVNNNTISITQNGTAVDSFTLNQNSNKTIEVKDEKVKQTEITNNKTFKSLAIASDNTTTTDTDGVEKCNGLAMRINKQTRPELAHAVELCIGNDIPVGTDTNYVGVIKMFGTHQYYTSIHAGNSTDDRDIVFPDADGTVALQSELPTNPVLWSEYNVLGAKNLIPYPWSASGMSSMYNRGITFTYDEEGYVTLNGTADATNQPYMCFTLATDAAAEQGNELIIESGKKYTLNIDRTDNRLWSIVFIRDTSGASASVATRAVYEDGTVRELTTDFISLLYNSVFHKEVTFEILTSGSYRLQVDLRVSNNSGLYTNAKGRVMLRYGEIVDGTWEKYAKSNYELTTQKAEVKDLEKAYTDEYNLLHQLYYDQIQNKRVYRGVTFDINKDSIRVSGTASTSNPYYIFRSWADGYCPNKNEVYHLEGCPSGGSTNSYYLVCQFVNSGGTTISYAYDYGSGVDFVLPDGTASIGIIFYVKAKYAISGTKTVAPKLTVARKFPTYQIGTIENGANASRAYAKNELMIWLGDLHRVTQAITSGGSITLNTNVVATTLSAEIKAIRDALNI